MAKNDKERMRERVKKNREERVRVRVRKNKVNRIRLQKHLKTARLKYGKTDYDIFLPTSEVGQATTTFLTAG